MGTTTRQRVAVVDFEVRGNPTLPDAGVIIADRVRSGLSPKWFDLIERTQLRKLLDEHDLQSAGLLQPDARRALGRVANVSHLVLGSVTRTHEVVVDARLVEVATGRIVRQAAATVASIDLLDAAADRLAAVLSAADAQYAEIVARRRRQQADALDAEPRITRQGNNLRIRLRVATAGKTELVHVREVRNTMRNLFVDYCHGQLGLNTSKAALIDHCREHEECEDIRTVGAMKEYTYMVPLPD
ncbi:MAG: hypothetical protein GY778_21755 [bacterium]|nr:hypothetical protein [bacterium]